MKFTLLHIARAGSTCLNRFFLDLGIKMTRCEVSHPDSPYRKDFNTYAVTECLDRLFAEWHALRHNYSTLTEKRRNEEFVAYHRDHGYRIIYLKREPGIALALSEVLAIQTGVWAFHTPDLQEYYVERTKGIEIDISLFRKHVKAGIWLTKHIEQYVKQDFVKWVRYEDLYNVTTSQNRAKLTELCEFIEFPIPSDVDEKIYDRFLPEKKIVSRRILEQIANLDEVEAVYKEMMR